MSPATKPRFVNPGLRTTRPEATRLLRLSSATLLRVLASYGGPAGLAADDQAAARLQSWGGKFLSADKVQALGGDPFGIPATPDGIWPGLYGKDGDHPDTDGQGDGPMIHAGHDATGKVSGLLFDHFGEAAEAELRAAAE